MANPGFGGGGSCTHISFLGTPQPLYNTIVWDQANFCVSYPNCVIMRVKSLVIHINLFITQFVMSPPCKGRETYCFSPWVCVSVGLWVCLSVRHKSCPLYNLITVTDISTKLHTFVKHIETTCHAQEP